MWPGSTSHFLGERSAPQTLVLVSSPQLRFAFLRCDGVAINGLQQKPVAEIIPITRMTQSARFLAGPAFTLHPAVVFTCSMSHANGFMRTSQWAMDW